MATNPYISLMSSDSSHGGYFRVIQSGYNVTRSKTSQVKHTVEGGLDVCQGKVYLIHNYMIKTRELEQDAGYASHWELEQLYDLTDPGATPSDVLTLVDHLGNSHTCYLLGDLSASALGCLLEGPNAWFLTQIQLQIIPT